MHHVASNGPTEAFELPILDTAVSFVVAMPWLTIRAVAARELPIFATTFRRNATGAVEPLADNTSIGHRVAFRGALVGKLTTAIILLTRRANVLATVAIPT